MQNNKQLKKYLIIEVIFICIVSSILHFVFELFDKNIYIASFVPVNESVWEHLKLPFYACLIYNAIFHIKMYKNNNYILGTSISLLVQPFFILSIFYICKNVLGVESLIIDILSLYFSVAVSIYVKYLIMTKVKYNKQLNVHSGIIIILLILIFTIFTYVPPKIEVFRDVETNTYGIN